MKLLPPMAALAVLSACDLTSLPQGLCGDGYVQHTSPAGSERCIKPGMAMGEGVIDSAIILGVSAGLAGIPKPF